MTHAVTALAAIGAYVLLSMAVDYTTAEGDRLALAEEHRLNTPHCDASIRQYHPAETPGFYRCAKAAMQ